MERSDFRLIPLILCGGAGTRLWPVSREDLPKQFISLLGERTSFQDAVLRVADPALFAAPYVITNARYSGVVAAQLQEIGVEATVLIEPSRQDSGPAIAAAAAFIAQQDPASIVMVLPSDHVVRDEPAFKTAARQALAGAQAGYIVTFGIEPHHPATGYGYIRPGQDEIGPSLRKVAQFVEKPNQSTAERYLKEGYLWNAGYFVFRVEVLTTEYETFDPDTMASARIAAVEASPVQNGLLLNAEAFARCRPQSIDYAVIEASKRVAVTPVSMGWSDVGSWHAVWELSDKDHHGNVAQGEAIFIDAQNNFVNTKNGLVCLVGLDNMGVIATPDAILVYDRRDDTSMKKVVAELKKAGHPALSRHSKA